MLGYRNVRKAENIPQEHRDLFERCGETVVQLTVTSGAQETCLPRVGRYERRAAR